MPDNFWTITASVAAALSALYAFRSNLISERALKLAQQQYQDRQSNFSLYLINSFRWTDEENTNRKFLIFHCTITNKSENKSSYKSKLEIEYIRADNSIARAIFEHNPKLIDFIPQKELSVFPMDIRIDEKGIDSGWLIFEEPINVFNGFKIDKYTIKLIDINGNAETSDVFIMKELTNETNKNKS
jgi:hypothetical protein